MAFDIPTLPALVERAARGFRLNLKGSDAWLFPNNVAASAKVVGGAVWEPFAFLAYIQRQAFAHLAEGSFLDWHGREYDMPRLAPRHAAGTVTLYGTTGTVVPAGLELQRADGVRYEITSGGTVASGTVAVLVTALEAGKAGNAVANVGVSLTAPFTGLTGLGVVATAGIGTGADLEGDEAYRSRILFRKRNVPHGGAAHDYVMWVRDINGVTRVFVDPVAVTTARTTVGIWFLMDDTYTNGIPLDADVTTVAAYIETLRPAGARVVIAKPTPVTTNITISGLSPDTAAIRDAVSRELRDLFRREMRVSTQLSPAKVYRSKIWEAVSIAAGEDHHAITVPSTDTVLTEGQIAVLGSITFS